MEADVLIVLVLVAGFALGVFRGAIRQLIVLGAWLVAFVVAPYARPLVGDWILSNAPEYSREYVDMLAFVVSFTVLFVIALLVIEIGGRTLQISQRAGVDEVLGGFLMMGATLLAIATLIFALDTYYLNPVLGGAEQPFVSDVYAALERSTIVESMRNALIPGLVAIFGPLLPADIRSVYA